MHIFFDFDGTLISAEKRMYRLYADYCRRLGTVPIQQSLYIAQKKRGIRERDVTSVALGSEVDVYLKWKLEHMEDPSYIQLDTLYKGVPTILKKLQKLGNSLYILTSRVGRAKLMNQVKQYNIEDYFIEIINTPGADGARCKTKGLSDAMVCHHIHGQSMVLVGDSEVEVQAANNVGIACISVTYGLRGKEFFHSLGQSQTVDSVSELTDSLLALQKSMV
ncbi:hypothetical protein A2Z00_03935 [Candidatus Gottesmanbacteria bacterium RBG_13_45_10]|uniref:Phosphoglycolate phosphatase n=1 Tax=Candidatus Gottesmanbacteria bacterium RBG_13_45_10 TaxID=1798370 RepID=A0A1F5ZHL4_9BACT|nr:MAG: hypothetical protein A2Z00_03935 [Candidatus Gottesmanbacteria bacterium RBG_13_45_10]